MPIKNYKKSVSHNKIKKNNNKKTSATRGAQLVPIGIPTICPYNFEPNLIRYFPKRQKLSDMTAI